MAKQIAYLPIISADILADRGADRYLSILPLSVYLLIVPLSADRASICRYSLYRQIASPSTWAWPAATVCWPSPGTVAAASSFSCGLGWLQRQATCSSIGRYEAYLQILKSIGRYCSLSADYLQLQIIGISVLPIIGF